MTAYEIFQIIISGITAFGFGLLAFYIHKAEQRREEREKKRDRNMCLMYGIEEATLDLCEATAIAYQRGAPNGEMETALAKAKQLRNERKMFITEQGIENLQRS